MYRLRSSGLAVVAILWQYRSYVAARNQRLVTRQSMMLLGGCANGFWTRISLISDDNFRFFRYLNLLFFITEHCLQWFLWWSLWQNIIISDFSDTWIYDFSLKNTGFSDLLDHSVKKQCWHIFSRKPTIYSFIQKHCPLHQSAPEWICNRNKVLIWKDGIILLKYYNCQVVKRIISFIGSSFAIFNNAFNG